MKISDRLIDRAVALFFKDYVLLLRDNFSLTPHLSLSQAMQFSRSLKNEHLNPQITLTNQQNSIKTIQ